MNGRVACEAVGGNSRLAVGLSACCRVDGCGLAAVAAGFSARPRYPGFGR